MNSTSNNASTNRYAAILAGGEGSRLRSLTRAIVGDERPKQFCPIIGGRSLLEVTRSRAELKIAPANILYSLTAKHARYFRPILESAPHRNLVVQPENKGTAPAILYCLQRLSGINPEATIVFLPSDHYFSDDELFMEKVETAFQVVESGEANVVLLGIEPTSAETSYGYIEPHESLFGGLANSVSRVGRFWEKPSATVADGLLLRGCLWNSFVMVARAATLIDLFERKTPDLYRVFRALESAGPQTERAIVRSIYSWINEVNFSSEILERSAESLHVMRVADVTWSDLGEPQRVIGTLSDLGLRTEWMLAAA